MASQNLLSAIVALAATAHVGATDHLAAMLLRCAVAAAVISMWPARGGHLRAVDVVLPVCIAVALASWATPAWGAAIQGFISASFVIYLYFALSLAAREWTDAALACACGSGVIHAAWAFVQKMRGDLRGSGGFFSPNDLAAFLAPLFAFGLWQIITTRARRRWLWGGVSSGMALGLWASGSRGGTLAAALAAGLVAWHVAGRRLKGAGALLGLVTVALIATRERWFDAGDRYAYSRWRIWQQSMAQLWGNPWGGGLGRYADTMRRVGVPIDGYVRYPHVANNGHAEWAHAAVELGWMGLLAVLTPALWLAWRGRGRPLGPAMWVAFALPAVTSMSLHVPPVALLGAIWAAHLVRSADTPGPLVNVPGWPRWTILICLFLALPGAIGQAAMQRAVALRDGGDVAAAGRWAEGAALAMPWSPGAAMLSSSLHFQATRDLVLAGEELTALADQFPDAPEPVLRAAQLFQASADDDPRRWQTVSTFWQETGQRDPHNALVWVELARARQRIGDLAGARTAFARALTEEPWCARAAVGLAALTDDPAEAAALKGRAREAGAHMAGYHGYAEQVLTLDGLAKQLLETP